MRKASWPPAVDSAGVKYQPPDLITGAQRSVVSPVVRSRSEGLLYLVRALGGPKAVASRFGRSDRWVIHWRTGDRWISPEVAAELAAAAEYIASRLSEEAHRLRSVEVPAGSRTRDRLLRANRQRFFERFGVWPHDPENRRGHYHKRKDGSG